MKMIKMALLAGSAVAVTAVAAHADELDSLKAQIETLNARVAAMETAPAVPAGYQLIAVSEGETAQTPGLPLTAREQAAYGNKATVISVLPTADAPAGTTITWSGYARAGLVHSDTQNDLKIREFTRDTTDDEWVRDFSKKWKNDGNNGDTDVKARGQLRVNASTDTAVGEVGVDIRLRGNFNGNGAADVYSDVAWGYWAMTPELTLGGGYAGSLGNIGYGYDGACTCYYTDGGDVAFDPGDTTQFRLSYGSGPFTMAIALEDASIRSGGDDFGANDSVNRDKLGVAGEIKYSGDSFSGEISGVWRDVNDYNDPESAFSANLDPLWQVGAGVGFSLGDIASLSLAAATGGGPATRVYEGNITGAIPYNETWWGVSGLASFNMTDAIHAELGAGYKKRDGDSIKDAEGDHTDGIDYDTYSFLGGLYYNPVDQLTIGIEGEWYTKSASLTGYDKERLHKADVNADQDVYTVDLVSVWRF